MFKINTLEAKMVVKLYPKYVDRISGISLIKKNIDTPEKFESFTRAVMNYSSTCAQQQGKIINFADFFEIFEEWDNETMFESIQREKFHKKYQYLIEANKFKYKTKKYGKDTEKNLRKSS